MNFTSAFIMASGILADTATRKVPGYIKFFASIVGPIMKGLYYLLNQIGIYNVSVAIIFFTIVVNMLMIPITYKQQKFSKMNAKMSPELNAIREKYQGKTDNNSRIAMQEETQQIYDKYGVSPMGSCLPLLIQLPIIMGVYQVATNVGEYVNLPENMNVNNFFLLNIKNSPVNEIKAAFAIGNWGVILLAVLVPILSGLTQLINMKLSTAANPVDENNPAMKSMKVMNYSMPIISLVMVFSFPLGVGIYWIASAVVRSVQQIILNKHFDKLDFDKIIEANKEKAAKKREKREGYTRSAIQAGAKMNTRNYNFNEVDKEEALKDAYVKKSNAKPGSMASKANLVRDYNNRNDKMGD